MSYTPTTWQTGDTITAEKLNNMESGINEAVDNAPLVLHLLSNNDGYYIDAQYADVLSAILAGRSVFLCATAISGSPMYFYAAVEDAAGDNEKITFMSGASVDERRILKWAVWYKSDGSVSLSTVDSDKDFYISLTPTSPDFSGTTDESGLNALYALQNRQKIMFAIDALSVVFPATMFALFDADNDGIIDSVSCGAIVPYNVSGQDVLIKIVTSPNALTYSTTIYPLTPMS